MVQTFTLATLQACCNYKSFCWKSVYLPHTWLAKTYETCNLATSTKYKGHFNFIASTWLSCATTLRLLYTREVESSNIDKLEEKSLHIGQDHVTQACSLNPTLRSSLQLESLSLNWVFPLLRWCLVVEWLTTSPTSLFASSRSKCRKFELSFCGFQTTDYQLSIRYLAMNCPSFHTNFPP